MIKPIPSRVGITDLVRLKLYAGPDGLLAEPVALRGAGLLSTLVRANAVLEVPGEVDALPEGGEVEVLLLGVPELVRRLEHEEAG